MAGGVRFVLEPQRRKMRRKIVSEDPADLADDSGRAGDSAAFGVLGQKRRFVGEDRLDGFAEVRLEFVVETLIDQPDETGNGLGVENIGTRRLILRHLPVIGAPRRGCIDAGAEADVAVFQKLEGSFGFIDCGRARMAGSHRRFCSSLPKR